VIGGLFLRLRHLVSKIINDLKKFANIFYAFGFLKIQVSEKINNLPFSGCLKRHSAKYERSQEATL